MPSKSLVSYLAEQIHGIDFFGAKKSHSHSTRRIIENNLFFARMSNSLIFTQVYYWYWWFWRQTVKSHIHPGALLWLTFWRQKDQNRIRLLVILESALLPPKSRVSNSAGHNIAMDFIGVKKSSFAFDSTIIQNTSFSARRSSLVFSHANYGNRIFCRQKVMSNKYSGVLL